MFLIPETPISRWNRSKGAYYDGNVQSYDHDTGKHLVVFGGMTNATKGAGGEPAKPYSNNTYMLHVEKMKCVLLLTERLSD